MAQAQENCTAEEFAVNSGLQMTVSYIPNFYPLEEFKETKHWPMFRFNITLSKGRVSHTFQYSMGCGNSKLKSVNKTCNIWSRPVLDDEPTIVEAYATNTVSKLGAKTYTACTPTLTDVLYSLVSDSGVLNYSCFEDWADAYGYDEDSRQAEATYKTCIDNALKMRQLIDINAAQAAFQDY